MTTTSNFNTGLFQSLTLARYQEAARENKEVTPEEIADLMRLCGGCEPWITRHPNGEVTVENDVYRTRVLAPEDRNKKTAENWHRRRGHTRIADVDLGNGATAQLCWR